MEEEQKPKHITIREPAVTILEAELAASPADKVVQWLEARSSAAKESTEDHDDQLESTLLARNDPLIDLALARYGIKESTAQELFSRTHTPAVRLAVLTNTALARHARIVGGLVEVLIGHHADLGEWLSTLSNEELGALFRNPSVGPSFLAEFLEGKNGWERFGEAQQLFILRMVKDNPLVSTDYESIEIDGYEEYKHSAVHDAVWLLARSAPKTVPWCHALSSLFEKTIPQTFSIKKPLRIVERWKPDADEKIEYGYLGHFGEVRCQIARLMLGSLGDGVEPLLANDDPAVRAAAYRYGALTEEQIRGAGERDPGFAFESLVRNEFVWRRESTRGLVRELAWKEPDPHSRMDAPNMYRYLEAKMEAKHPNWFETVNEAANPDGLPVTRGEFNESLASLAFRIDGLVASLAIIQGIASAILSRSGWLWWGVAVTIGLLIYHLR